MTLREQAMERIRQMEASQTEETASSQEETVQPPSEIPPQPAIQQPFSFLRQLGIGKDQLILLITLFFLYKDHASPKILFAILYILM